MPGAALASVLAVVAPAAPRQPGMTTDVHLVKTTRTVGGKQYETYDMIGSGPQWRAFDGGIPGLYVGRDEMIDVTYHNDIAENSIVHAHGQKDLPADMDGVPDVSGPPMPPNGSFRINYKPSDGTYFIHSHWGLQHELGMAAPLVVEDTTPVDYPVAPALIQSARDVVMWIEDFCPRNAEVGVEDPSCFDAQSMYDALSTGWSEDAATWNFSHCMDPGLDSDVAYAGVLINDGVADAPTVVTASAGDVLRLRVINAAGFNPYVLHFPFNVTVVQADGNWVQPLSTDHVWIALAQRLDIIVQIPAGFGSWDISATAQGTSLKSTLKFAPPAADVAARARPHVAAFAPRVAGFMDFWDSVTLHAFERLSPRPVDRYIVLNVTGDNGFKAFNRNSFQLRPAAKVWDPSKDLNAITLVPGERLCINFTNFNADAHPIHLHGHFFQVLSVNGVDVDGPLRDTFDLARGACNRATMCFDADLNMANCKGGCSWPLHCHISYHLVAGMFTLLHYPAM